MKAHESVVSPNIAGELIRNKHERLVKAVRESCPQLRSKSGLKSGEMLHAKGKGQIGVYWEEMKYSFGQGRVPQRMYVHNYQQAMWSAQQYTKLLQCYLTAGFARDEIPKTILSKAR